MKTIKRPLGRSVAILCVIFVLAFTTGIVLLTWQLYTQTIYMRYQRQMDSIVSYIESFIDNDDMAECARTWTESEKYKETREVFDHFVDYYTDIHYLYIIKPMEPGEPVRVRSVLSANTTYEKTYTPETLVFIGDGEESWYPEETAQQFRSVMAGTRDVFFEEKTEWGTDYTMARPLINSAGEHYAVLCVDFSIDEITGVVKRNLNINIAFMLMMGALVAVFFIFWIRYNAAKPVRDLEDSINDLRHAVREKRAFSQLEYVPPKIQTKNEVESLSLTVTGLMQDLKDNVKDIAAGELEIKNLPTRPVRQQTVSYRDPVTGFKNRAAFEKKAKELNRDILCNQAEFALIEADLDGLREVSKSFGADKGEEYVRNAAMLLEKVFLYSPIYRVGNSEFVVVLEDSDYLHREDLLKKLEQEFTDALETETEKPWKRISFVYGYAVYDRDRDTNVDPVFVRANEEINRKRKKTETEQ